MAERARLYRAQNPERVRAIRRKTRAKYQERQSVYALVHEAIRRGELLRPEACELCGARKRLSAHHHDYDRPLDVIFLCGLCHKAVHRMAKSFLAAMRREFRSPALA